MGGGVARQSVAPSGFYAPGVAQGPYDDRLRPRRVRFTMKQRRRLAPATGFQVFRYRVRLKGTNAKRFWQERRAMKMARKYWAKGTRRSAGAVDPEPRVEIAAPGLTSEALE